MLSQSERPLALLAAARLIPLVTIERVEDAMPLAQALVDGGLATMEIALRTPAAPHAIRQIVRNVPAAIPAAGNIMTPRDLALAAEVGARFALSPGSSPALLDAAAAGSLPFVPGIATPTELMQVMSKGFHVVKFFPSVPFGGPATLRALIAPFPHARFCPTGGTSEADQDAWFALPNVIAIGGQWLAPPQDIRRGNWAEITRRAREAKARVPV